MPDPALTPQAAIDRLGAMSGEVRSACLLDERGKLAAHTGDADVNTVGLCGLTGELFRAADAAGARAGVEQVARVEVSRPDGGVFGLRDRDRSGKHWTLVAVTAGGALASLVLYDMKMTVRAIGSPDTAGTDAGPARSGATHPPSPAAAHPPSPGADNAATPGAAHADTPNVAHSPGRADANAASPATDAPARDADAVSANPATR